MTLNGSSRLNDTRLQLTDGGNYEAGSAFYSVPVDIRAFKTDFSFQLSNASADGFTFAIQSLGLTRLADREALWVMARENAPACRGASRLNSISITATARASTRSAFI